MHVVNPKSRPSVRERLAFLMLVLFFSGFTVACRSTEVSVEDSKNSHPVMREEVSETMAITSTESHGPTRQITIYKAGQLRLEPPEVPIQVHVVGSREELEQLDYGAYEEFQMYDEKYFESQALVLATFNARSGSTIVDIRRVEQEGDEIRIALSGHVEGMGTMDLAAFLIWAEIPKELTDYQWTIQNHLGFAEK